MASPEDTMRKIIIASLTAVSLISNLGTAAVAQPYGARQGSQHNEQARDHQNDNRNNREAFRDRRIVDQRQGSGYYNRTYGETHRNDSSAIAAGFLGFVLGAAIAGNSNDRSYANNRHNNRSWNNACSRRYRSFDRNSGTYLGYDGYRHYCR